MKKYFVMGMTFGVFVLLIIVMALIVRNQTVTIQGQAKEIKVLELSITGYQNGVHVEADYNDIVGGSL